MSEPVTTNKFIKQSLYKCYKIVHVLGIVCKIKLKKLKLRWILN